MIPKEITKEVVDKETGEITIVSNFKDGLLYGLFSVVSNKTVRAKENKLRTWWNNVKEVPSKKMQKTNRGWFIDGYNVDERSINLWFKLTENDRYGQLKPKKKWNFAKKHVKKS